jgi:integrase/recombinase XerC
MVSALVAGWQKSYAKSTTYRYRGILVRILRMLEEAGAPAITAPRVKPGHQRATVASPDELVRLLATPPPWLKLFILLYLQCGLRASEALAVTPRTWDTKHHTVTIPIKGDRIRTAEVTPDAEILFYAAGDCPPDTNFIDALHGKHISPRGIRQAWLRHKARCGVNPELTAHDLRRTAATILYHATKDLRVPQQLLGHQSLTSTLNYLAPLAPDEARRYAELLRFDKFKSEVKQ